MDIVSKVIKKLSKTLATAPSLDRIKKLISEYYMGSTITLNPLNDKEWSVHNSKGEISGVKVKLERGRYKFEDIS